MIRLDNINKIYNKGRKNEFHALIDINLHIYPGEMIAVTGKSGAGKSTLLNILACMDRPDSGIYYWYDQPVGRFSEKRMARMRNEKIGIVVQDFALIEDFTVYENVSLPMEIAGSKRSGRRDKIQEVLHIVGMESYANCKIRELSGGQKQRTAIARAIINEPDIVLADEPTGALDSDNTKMVMQLFKDLNESGKAVVIATHDPDITKQCGKIIEMEDGRIRQHT